MPQETKSTSYRWCIVPKCNNTSIKTTEKVFIQLPKDEPRRRLWFNAVKRDYYSMSKTSNVFVCEDHFDLENDMENYMRWKLTGGVKIMKKTAVPHRFDCLKGRKIVFTSAPRSVTLKQTGPQLVEEELFTSAAKVKVCVAPADEPVSQSSVCGPKEDVNITVETERLHLPINRITSHDISKLAVEHTMRIVNMKPNHYIGLKKECMFVIDLLEQYTHLDAISILLTLQKIRLAQKFCELGDAYGMSGRIASRKFSTSVSLISELMGEFIIWPPKEKILALLPVPFRTRYSKLEFIIDCFEIEIQKPTDVVKQAVTWSDYNKAHTLKYLVSSTPDGVVNFISKAFGGRTSDALVVEKSGFLDRLQPGAVVMAAQGLKHIEHLFIQKQCTLWRPPIHNISGSQEMDNTHEIKTKRLLNLRIRIEQMKMRLREFNFLKPHSRVSSELVPYMDFIMVIVCGLINL